MFFCRDVCHAFLARLIHVRKTFAIVAIVAIVAMSRIPRLPLIILAVLAALSLTAVLVWQYGIRNLRAQIEQTLGPRGEVRELRVGLTGVEIVDLRIAADPATTAGKAAAWPNADELRARRIVIRPDIGALLTGRVTIDSIQVEGAYLPILRSRDGHIRMLPSLLEKTPAPGTPTKTGANTKKHDGGSGQTPAAVIDGIVLNDGVIEFYDASLPRPAQLRLENIEASIGRLRLPALDGQTSIRVDGAIKGPQRDGRLSINGWAELASKESGLTVKLRGVDMTVLQPYLLKAADADVRRGTLDLDLNSSINKGRLRAPGTLTLSGLELAGEAGAIFGLPRNVALDLLKDRKGRIGMHFVLEGDVADPHFSLNEQLSTRFAWALAEALGISLESLARGVGAIGGGSARAIGESLGKLLGR